MPARARLAPLLACGALAGGSVSLCACGAKQPQAPKVQAERVAAALEGIAAACGESYQQLAFARSRTAPGGERYPSATLAAAALQRAQELADVYLQNPDWIYQSETLRQLVALSVSRLRECALTDASRHLLHAAPPGR
jgi:hypothetical protein